jgi:NADPH oxidase
VFWYTHHLAFFFMIGLYTHATGCFVRDSVDPDLTNTFPFYSTDHCLGYFSWRFTIWPGIIYFGERVFREYRARRATRLSKVLVHPSGPYIRFGYNLSLLHPAFTGAMELRIIKSSFKYTAGQWLFFQVPELSRWQWHPVCDCLASPKDGYARLTDTSSPSPLRLKIHTSLFTFVRLVILRVHSANVSASVPLSSLL